MPTATIYVARDSWINGHAKTTNYGAAQFVEIGVGFAGSSKNKLARSLLDFDVSSLSAYVIDAAKMVRDYSNVQNGGFPAKVYRCTRPGTWVESEVTYDNYKAATPWTDNGGDFDLQVPTPVAYNEATYFGDQVTVLGLREFVVDAILNRSSVVSLLLHNDDENTINAHWAEFTSRERFGGANSARLVIDYTVPVPAAPGRRGTLPGFGERRARAPATPSGGRRPLTPSKGRNP